VPIRFSTNRFPELPMSFLAPAVTGRLLVFSAAVLWSLSGVLVKNPALDGVSGNVLAGFRALTAGVCLVPLVPVRAVRFRPLLIPLVLSFASMNLLFMTAMTLTTAAATTFLQYTSTFWAFVFGVVFLREPVERGNLVALAFGLLGIGWIVGADWAGERFIGNLFALASGISYAGVIVCLRQLRGENAAWLVALNHLFSGLILLPWVWSAGVGLSSPQWGLISLLGVVQMALPYVLFTIGVRWVPAQEAALITLIEPLLNPLWVWIFWREPVESPTWAGGGMILAGLALRAVAFRPAARELAADGSIEPHPTESSLE
jgi:drug/metabolite transporter (DMT)-like permease